MCHIIHFRGVHCGSVPGFLDVNNSLKGDLKMGLTTRGFQKVRGKVPSYSYFVNQVN